MAEDGSSISGRCPTCGGGTFLLPPTNRQGAVWHCGKCDRNVLGHMLDREVAGLHERIECIRQRLDRIERQVGVDRRAQQPPIDTYARIDNARVDTLIKQFKSGMLYADLIKLAFYAQEKFSQGDERFSLACANRQLRRLLTSADRAQELADQVGHRE